MAFSDFQDGVAYLCAVQQTQYVGGRDWQAGYDSLRDNSPNLIGSEFKKAQDAIQPTLGNATSWNTRFRSAMTPWLQYGMTEIAESSGTQLEMLDNLVRYMNANDIYVDSDRVTYGANPADNVIGLHRRITVNKYGQRIENGDHELPNGIKITVRESEATGAGDVIQVEYSGENNSADRRNSLRKSGFVRKTQQNLVGPRNTGLAANAVLQGNADETDGAAITDGDASDGGIQSWDQIRTGSPTVVARPNDAFGDQPYGIGIGAASATFQMTQSYSGWGLQANTPAAVMFPLKLSGIAWEGDITWALGAINGTYDETDLTDGVYVPLFTDLNENAFPDSFDDTGDLFSLTFAMDAFVDGGEEVILGGVYVMLGFQLQNGGEWHFAWERGVEPTVGNTVSFGADAQSDANELQECFCRAFPEGPSLPVSGSSLWSGFAGPSMATGALPNGQVSVAYSQSLVATGGLAPLSYSIVDGALPTGLTLNATTGLISGTPTVAATFDFVAETRDALGRTAHEALSILINP